MPSKLCEICDLAHPPLVTCLEAFKQQMKSLLLRIGTVGECRGCHATIFWVRHLNGKAAPYTAAGLNHFIDCPKADQWRQP